jgi:hypothetical protein
MEVSLHDISTMTAVRDAIISEKLQHNTHRIFITVWAILTNSWLPLSKFVDSCECIGAIRAFVSCNSFRTSVLTVIEGGMVESIAPSEWTNWLMFIQVVDEFLNDGSALFSLHVNTVWSLVQFSLKLRNHCLKLWNDWLWILAYLIEALMNLFS